ncbi:MAG TPA: amino acid adenylation domain-containing protein, partial [Polyangiaceae bacterium]
MGFADLSQLPDAARREAIQAEHHKQVAEPFDLSQAPLFRARLLAVGSDEHLLLISAHHIVCDGWSMAVCLQDLAELYAQAVSNAAPALGERPSFSDYAEVERKQTSSDEYRAAERYWLDRFQGELPVVDLPADHARPAFKSYASDRVDYVLDAELVTKLKELGARRGASFFVTLLAAFKTFVFRLTGAEDLVVGIPAAGQSFMDMPKLVGHCVNMLPLRSRLSSELPFSELLGNVRRELLDAYERQQLTFGALLRKLALPRDPSRLPLITLAFNLDQAILGESLKLPGLQVDIATTPRAFENFDLFINAAEKRGVVTLESQYNTALFDRTSVERWLSDFEVLLRSLADSPESALSEHAFVSQAEAAQLASWNAASQRNYDRHSSLAGLILEQCHKTPERVAVQASDGPVTYAELDRRSAALGARLRAQGIGRGSLVGISLERSSRLIVAVLAVLRSGAGYVPLDPSFPLDRLKFMAEDSGLGLLLSERSLGQDLGLANVPRLFLDEEQLEAASSSPDAGETAPADPAYVIYTSGSTGTPKGVVVPNGAAVNFLRSMREQPGLGEHDRLLAVTTLSFDISVLELWLPLSIGATVVLATAAQAMDGAALRSLLHEQRANVLQATPATFRLLLAAGEEFGSGFKALCGGEALPKTLANQLLASGLELWNMYGPTETTVWSTCHRILPDAERMLVGKPIANTQLYIVDAKLRSVPVGVTGELCIAGDGVTLGYHQRPELTADRFVANPFGPGRLYRTGDLARFMSDGNVECLGRSDGQVKLRGYRIELGEIETVLARHEDVRQAVVVIREDRPGDQRLVAYVVPRERLPEIDVLREHLKRSLPDYMVPQNFMEMSALPLTPNGKIDKKKLPAPVAASSTNAASFVPAETESEKLLQKIWQKVLGSERVSATDDFFQLGGHSLLAAQVMSQITRETGVTLSMRRMFEAPTFRALAKILDEAQSASTGSAESATIPRLPPNTLAPLSPMQQRLWFMEDMNPGTAVYNLPSCFRLHGTLNIRALEQALDTIAERHASIRSTLGWHDGQLRQRVLPTLKFQLNPRDLSAKSPSEREEELLRLAKAAAAEPFDLSNGPLARAALYILGPSESAL